MKALAALSAAIAIMAGAFGAHAAPSHEAAEWLKTGAFYHLIHAVAVLSIEGHRTSQWLWLGGSALFAGTLYLMAMGLPRWLGAITPVGGTLMIAGWICLAISYARAPH